MINIEEKLAFSEKQLMQEAGSFKEIFAKLQNQVSPKLIGDSGWERLFECASHLPSSLAAFPFGFEFPLNRREATADFGISVVTGTQTETFFRHLGAKPNATPPRAGFASLLAQTSVQDSALRQIVGHKFMLEYDTVAAKEGFKSEPGLFLRPVNQFLCGGSNRPESVVMVLDAVSSAVGWEPDCGEREHTLCLYEALVEPKTQIVSIGAFPSRKKMMRLTVSGFENSPEVLGFLERIGWNDTQFPTIESTIEKFQANSAFADLGLHFDVTSEGLLPRLGLSVMAKKRVANDPLYWVDKPGQWSACLNTLKDKGFGINPEKLQAMHEWVRAPEVLMGKTGALILIRGIHHFKLELVDNNSNINVKGYAYFLLCPWMDKMGVFS